MVGSMMLTLSDRAVEELDAAQQELVNSPPADAQARAELIRDIVYRTITLAAVAAEFVGPLGEWMPTRIAATLSRARRRRPGDWTQQLDRMSYGAVEVKQTALGFRVITERTRDRSVFANTLVKT